MNKELGKIQRAEYGLGGYQEAQLGISFTLGGKGWGVGDFWGVWADRSENSKWTHEDRAKQIAEVNDRLRDLLRAGNVDSVSRLIGLPIEATFENMSLVSW